MAALTDHRKRAVTDAHLMDRTRDYDVDAGAVHYEGAIAYMDAATGRAVVTSASGANEVAGIVYRAVDNTGGAITTDKPLVVETGQIEEMTLTGVTEADKGKYVYADNNNDLTLTSGTNSRVGWVHSVVDTNIARIKIDPAEV